MPPLVLLNDYYGYPMGWRYGYYRPYGTQRTYVYDYQQGTIIIDIVDPKTRKLMWRGSASDEVREKTTPEKRQQKITEAVDTIAPDAEGLVLGFSTRVVNTGSCTSYNVYYVKL